MANVAKKSVLGTCIRKGVRVYRVRINSCLSVPTIVYLPIESTTVVDYTIGCSKFQKPVPQDGRDKDFWNRIPLDRVVLPEDNTLIEYDGAEIFRHKVPKGAIIVPVSFGRPEWAGTVGVILP